MNKQTAVFITVIVRENGCGIAKCILFTSSRTKRVSTGGGYFYIENSHVFLKFV